MEEAGFVLEGGVVGETAVGRQFIHNRPQQPVQDRLIQAGQRVAGQHQQFGVQRGKGDDVDVERAAFPGQPPSKGAHLGRVRQDRPDGGQRLLAARGLNLVNAELGLTGGGRGQEDVGVHCIDNHQEIFTTKTPRHKGHQVFSSYFFVPSCLCG